jgi:CRP-like cAMP-binding protein
MPELKPIKESRLIESIIDFLIDIPLFDELKASDLRLVARQMNMIDVEKNDHVFHEGEKGDYMCFVVEGTLEVIKQTVNTRDVVIASLSRGRSIGEMSVIDDYPRSATVKARTRSTLAILSRNGMEVILREHPQIGIKILRALARLLSMNLRRTSSQLADLLLSQT